MIEYLNNLKEKIKASIKGRGQEIKYRILEVANYACFGSEVGSVVGGNDNPILLPLAISNLALGVWCDNQAHAESRKEQHKNYELTVEKND